MLGVGPESWIDLAPGTLAPGQTLGATVPLFPRVERDVSQDDQHDAAATPTPDPSASPSKATAGAPAGPHSAVRKREAEACSRRMEFEIVAFLDLPDGDLARHEDRIATRVREIIDTWKPTQIICPFLTDHHRYHEATASAVALALRGSHWSGDVWGFEVWSTIWPNVIVDITSVVEKKRAGIACHASQIAGMDYTEATLGLNRFRGLRVDVHYGEAFHVCPAGRFVELASSLMNRV